MKEIKTIALVAPSGNIRDKNLIDEKIEILKKQFKVKKYYSEDVSNGYLSDSDENRARFFEDAFSDEEVDLVLSIRGGFGALRIVDKINYEKLKNCSKIYVGSSDATILLMALSNKTNIKCFHGLMITNGFVENLKRNIEIIENNIFDIDLKPLNNLKTKGRLWGGNLSSLVSTFSDNRYLPSNDIILFLEDLNEPLYKIDKMIYEIYRNQKLKEKIKGIIFGDFYFEQSDILPLLRDYTKLFNVPCFLTCDISHKTTNKTIPYNIEIEI